MKLIEIKPLIKFPKIDILTQDLSRLGISPHYEGLNENYIYPPVWDEWVLNEGPLPITWKHFNGGLKGRFTTPDFEYYVNFEPFDYDFNNKIYKCVNVSFEVIVNGVPTTDLTPTKYSNQVMGTIQNSLSEKLIQFDIDAVLFIAADNIERRMSLYGRMADKFAKQFGKVYRNIRLEKGEAIAILANRIPSQDQEKIKKFADDKNKNKPDLRN